MRTPFLTAAIGGAVLAAAALLPAIASPDAAGAAPPPCTTTCYVSPAGNDANGGGSFANAKLHIQAGIDAVSAGGTVKVKAGRYAENLTISSSLTLSGAGQGATVIYPALSAPNPAGCSGSLCTGASNVILVQASGVTITGLTVDGHNPALTSGVTAGGVDLDARNGIITNYLLGTPFNNLVVRDITVQNIYLRGIYASSGGSFTFDNNRVMNVQADPASIAMFAYGGPGTMTRNNVSWANDALSANNSAGIQFLNNVVTHSLSGVHTDNSNDAGGVADVIRGNTILCVPGTPAASTYGIFVFVPYKAPTVTGNSILGCDVGLAAYGSGTLAPASPPITTVFSNNTVIGNGGAGTVGALVTTDMLGYGQSPVWASFDHNSILGFESGFLVQEPGGQTATVTAHRNAIVLNSTWGVDNTGSDAVDATCNFWGSSSGPSLTGHNKVSANVGTSPWLRNLFLNSACDGS